MLLANQALSVQAEEATSKKSEVPQATDQKIERKDDTKAKGVPGIASYYANRFKGRKTTCGAPYDPKKLTAASTMFPLGTKVKVINKSNNKEVIVSVNDRCRKRKCPFIDLSQAAAEELGFFGRGTAKVVIMPIKEEKE
ncbi:MAG: septal ring lytic transglycosylase RlpA family protein [Desulfuromonadales bacterium]|nr:septal ring lytic transglycosylase RlpA family protein [Desulfuromonadales bacterium]